VARIAFIGVGTMGLPMARNLVAAGHDVVACDLDPDRARMVDGPVASTVREAVDGADLAIASLPTAEAVEDVGKAIAGTGVRTFVDMSTSPPSLARKLADELGASGTDVLDAPVSGGPHGASARTLSVMVGGYEAVFAREEAILRDVGAALVVRVGGPGAGQTAKLCNNLIAGATMVAVAEACAIAEREGIGSATLYEILTASTADSRVLRVRFPLPGVDAAHPSSRDYEPLFALDLIVKDLALAQALADEHGLAPNAAASALEEFRRAQAAGHGSLDYSAVYLTSAPHKSD
jgi:3-hydroxyisobutyrate dehydrogenase